LKKFIIILFIFLSASLTFSNNFSLRYHRFDGIYDDWNIWLWEDGKPGKSIPFNEKDDYGVLAKIDLDKIPTRYGFIIRKGNWEEKDVPMDRYININTNGQEFYLLQGDRNIYSRREEVDTTDRILSAIIKDKNIIMVELTRPISLKNPPEVIIRSDEGRNIDVKKLFNDDIKPQKRFFEKDSDNIKITFDPKDFNLKPSEIRSVFLATSSNGWKEASSDWRLKENNDVFQITKKNGIGKNQINDKVEFKFVVHKSSNTLWFPEGENLTIKNKQYKTSNVYLKTLEPLRPEIKYTVNMEGFKSKQAIAYDILDKPEYTFDGWLGYDYHKDSTTFRLWSPVSKNVDLILFKDLKGKDRKNIHMKKNGKIFEVKVSEDLKGYYYLYEMNQYSVKITSPDPWAFASSANGKYSAVIDIENTGPKGFSDSKRPEIQKNKSILYESHIRDLTMDKGSTSKYKGTYKGFGLKDTYLKTNKNISTGISHIRDLGATHIHILPIMDFASIDETKPDKPFNWGYDPFHYFIPEGSYSTDADDPEKRVYEVKEMIRNIHELGLGVVLDVVYNHTYSSTLSPLAKTVPYYYYRINNDCSFSNGSGCGNETASEHKMFRKHMIDSLSYFLKQYKVDGFRFDLMALHDIETMKMIDKRLRKIYKDVLLYGEPWKGGSSSLPDNISFYKGAQKGTGISVFNDLLRNAVKGDPDGDIKGFATGDISTKNDVIKGIFGGLKDFANSPLETINYVTCHDNMTFYDKLKKVLPEANEKEYMLRQCLSAGIIIFSEGIPFIHSGYEFLRTKDGEHNSYNLPDKINMIRWKQKEENYKMFDYFKKIIRIKKEYPHFRLESKQDVLKSITIMKTEDSLIAYTINYKGTRVLVCHNASRKKTVLKMKSNWNVILSGIESTGKYKDTRNIEIPGLSTLVAVER